MFENVRRSIPLDDMDESAGYLEFMGRFSTQGLSAVNEAHMCLKAPTRFRMNRCPASTNLVDAAWRLLKELQIRKAVTLLVNPFFLPSVSEVAHPMLAGHQRTVGVVGALVWQAFARWGDRIGRFFAL